ncbi:MAG: MerR family transcriptional regulator [Lachnospiraceae bacterium]|nr:MerR family transcriptional regulator [Lachnospiraceae bacterium]
MENVRYMISDAANIVNVESHVLRYWEEELELQIPRNEMGHRYYTEENIAQFQKIKEWKEQGYQLKAIRMMIHNRGAENSGMTEGKTMIKPERMPGNSPMAESEKMSGKVPMTEIESNAGALGEGVTGGNNVIQMNREYLGTEAQTLPVRNDRPASNTVKLEQFQAMMLTIVKQAVEENNQALGKEVGVQVGERVLKEMNYLMREQDEAEEERFRKLDAAIRTHQKPKRFRKEKKEKETNGKKLNPNLTV